MRRIPNSTNNRFQTPTHGTTDYLSSAVFVLTAITTCNGKNNHRLYFGELRSATKTFTSSIPDVVVTAPTPASILIVSYPDRIVLLYDSNDTKVIFLQKPNETRKHFHNKRLESQTTEDY